jgi:hypothetical protein
MPVPQHCRTGSWPRAAYRAIFSIASHQAIAPRPSGFAPFRRNRHWRRSDVRADPLEWPLPRRILARWWRASAGKTLGDMDRTRPGSGANASTRKPFIFSSKIQPGRLNGRGAAVSSARSRWVIDGASRLSLTAIRVDDVLILKTSSTKSVEQGKRQRAVLLQPSDMWRARQDLNLRPLGS